MVEHYKILQKRTTFTTALSPFLKVAIFGLGGRLYVGIIYYLVTCTVLLPPSEHCKKRSVTGSYSWRWKSKQKHSIQDCDWNIVPCGLECNVYYKSKPIFILYYTVCCRHIPTFGRLCSNTFLHTIVRNDVLSDRKVLQRSIDTHVFRHRTVTFHESFGLILFLYIY